MRRTGKHRPRVPKNRASVAPEAESSPEVELRANAASGPQVVDEAPHVEEFFNAPEPPPLDEPSFEENELSDEILLERIARKQRARRIARVAVALGALLCIVALARALVPSDRSEATHTNGAPLPTPTAAPSPVVPATVAAPAPATASAPAEPAMAPTVVRPPPPQPVLDREAARQERWEAQAALEIGDLRRAAIVAERAVAHDPSEADGWLLLVAAQMDMGDHPAVRRSLAGCADYASRGPRGECMALIQSLPEARRPE